MTQSPESTPLEVLTRRHRAGEQRPSDHLATVRDRVGDVDPSIRALVEEPDRWTRLDREVAALEARHATPSRPPLFGIPIGVKDIFHVDGLETRAGSEVPPAALTGPEASSVTALTDAGAYVLGKTVTAEFAYFEPGPTRNPHDPDHTPGGSSSGSAAAVAAGFCPLALGTQTVGSVARPAAFCGVVGVKPSYGRIPTDGVIPAAPSVDHVGYFTPDASGARTAGSVLIDGWRAPADAGSPGRIGVVEGAYLEQADDVGREQFDHHVSRLEAAGFETVRVDPFPDIEAINERHTRLVAAEMALAHADWFREYGDVYADETAEQVRRGRDVSTGELVDARVGRTELRAAVHKTMDDHDVDVIVSPSAPGPAPAGIDTTGDPVMNLPWTHAGVPTVTLPATRTEAGLPLGLQCAARFGADERLLSWAPALETALATDA